MSESQPHSVMRRLSRDTTILAVIVCITMLLMNLRYHERYLEQNRSVLMYTTDVDKPRALQLFQAMADAGLFDGQQHSFLLSRPLGVWELSIHASPATLRTPASQQLLKDFFLPLCEGVFGEERLRVHLTDEELTPQLLLFELPE